MASVRPTGLLLALLIIGTVQGLVSACDKWEHRWRTVQESWQAEFQPEAVAALALVASESLVGVTQVLAPVTEQIHFPEFPVTITPWNSQDPMPDPADLSSIKGSELVTAVTPVLQQAHLLLAVDESLPILSLVKIENLYRTTIRWVKLDRQGTPLTLDETSAAHGVTLTVSVMPRWWPILRVERVLGDPTPERVASHSW
ncbi:MAG TPA: hypothetical protein PKO06_20780, partial [Candidatus Ozemobacteraceae bacterium]|nr:hypothetical protein [Candidatus Ozemobacteraceae bacterium]